MAVRLAQETVVPLVGGSPNARVSAENVNVLASGSPNARVSAENVNVLASGSPNARVSQEALVFLYLPGIFGGVSDDETFFYPMRAQVVPY